MSYIIKCYVILKQITRYQGVGNLINFYCDMNFNRKTFLVQLTCFSITYFYIFILSAKLYLYIKILTVHSKSDIVDHIDCIPSLVLNLKKSIFPYIKILNKISEKLFEVTQ